MIAEARESILRKIRKLLALSRGGTTEEEAAQAAQRAHELLAAHNLEMSEVEQVEESDRVLDRDSVDGSRDVWPAHVWHATARLHFCQHFYTEVPHDGRLIGLRHTVVGRRHNVEVTKMTALYLIHAVNRLATEGARLVPAEERRSWRDSFRRACGLRLAQRVHALHEASAAPAADVPRTTLPALPSLYRTEAAANAAMIARLGFRLSGPPRHDRLTHAGGADAGRRAAETISLHRQIGASAPPPVDPPRGRGASQIEMFA